jgi:hypothetical protein
MKKITSLTAILFAVSGITFAQEKEGKEHITVPSIVQTALHKKYPEAKKVSWEKENANYEANWGGKSGEDNSVQFSADGKFIEMVKAIPVNDLPKPVFAYVNEHYKGIKITEAGKVTDAAGKTWYEAEVKGKDVIFDENGNFTKSEK